jgi:hypothetical protein
MCSSHSAPFSLGFCGFFRGGPSSTLGLAIENHSRACLEAPSCYPNVLTRGWFLVRLRAACERMRRSAASPPGHGLLASVWPIHL